MRPFRSLKLSFSWLLTKQTFHEYLNEGIQPVETSKVGGIQGILHAVILKCKFFFSFSKLSFRAGDGRRARRARESLEKSDFVAVCCFNAKFLPTQEVSSTF